MPRKRVMSAECAYAECDVVWRLKVLLDVRSRFWRLMSAGQRPGILVRLCCDARMVIVRATAS